MNKKMWPIDVYRKIQVKRSRQNMLKSLMNITKDPKKIHLPAINMSSSFIFAKSDMFFAYPNRYNHFVSYYKNTYQHGGVSLEEMIIPT